MRIILERLACDMDEYTLQYREGLDVDDTAQVAKLMLLHQSGLAKQLQGCSLNDIQFESE